MRDRASNQSVACAVHINNQDRTSGQPLSSNCCHPLAKLTYRDDAPVSVVLLRNEQGAGAANATCDGGGLRQRGGAVGAGAQRSFGSAVGQLRHPIGRRMEGWALVRLV